MTSMHLFSLNVAAYIPPLTYNYNSFGNGYSPDHWKSALVLPVNKNSNRFLQLYDNLRRNEITRNE